MKKINRATNQVLYEIDKNRSVRRDIKVIIKDTIDDVGLEEEKHKYIVSNEKYLIPALAEKLRDYFIEAEQGIGEYDLVELWDLFDNLLTDVLDSVDWKFVARDVLKRTRDFRRLKSLPIVG